MLRQLRSIKKHCFGGFDDTTVAASFYSLKPLKQRRGHMETEENASAVTLKTDIYKLFASPVHTVL
jgi:hypothetical protein